ncbi:polysaccharide deacetylase family protein [Oscillospiraceae bacterium PP1C4]
MYGVYSKKTAIWAILCVLLGLFILMGLARHTIHTAAVPRELPIYSVETDKKLVSLGINCAWDDSDIDRLLQLLEEREVKATFFLVGNWCDKYPEAVKKLAAAGHELGSHSDTHPDMTKLTREQIASQLDASQKKIEALTGKPIYLFRPPSGAYNNLVVSTARQLGWEVIQWSNDSVDWKTPPVEEMVERVLKNAQPGDIMLFHAGKKNTPVALEIILDRLIADGYKFVPVGELIYPVPYTIDHAGRQNSQQKPLTVSG